MKQPDPESMESMIRFMSSLEKEYEGLGGVGCKDLIDPTRLSDDDLISELVFSILVWESSIEHALRAVDKMNEELVDLNELRVCSPEELVRIMPARYPRSLDRCQRLIFILNQIFERENQLSLSHLREMHKKEVVEYLGSIDGLPPFVSSRVILLGLGWHSFPIDDWLTKQLSRYGITDKSLSIREQTIRMERLVRASDALRFYTLIEHWATDQRAPKLAANNGTPKSVRTTPNTNGSAKSSASTEDAS